MNVQVGMFKRGCQELGDAEAGDLLWRPQKGPTERKRR